MDELGLENINKIMNDISSPNRNVTKHFVVTWTLAGVLDASYAPTFTSKDIDFGCEIGSCCLKVTPHFAEDFVVIQLITDVVENSFLNYRFGFMKENVEYWHDDQVCNFIGNISPSETLKTISNYFNYGAKTFQIMCQIMITALKSVPREHKLHSKNRHQLAICMDFYNIFDSEYLSDITLRVGENEVGAHKSILTAKSEVFRNMVDDMDESQNTLVLTETDVDVVRSMLIFMYTGNFEIWKTFYRPTIALYECLTKYAITDLRIFLTPVRRTLTDVCFIKTLEFTWLLKTSSEFKEAGPLSRKSPLLRTPFGSFCMNISTENSSGKFVKIMIESSNVNDNMTMNLKVQILDSENKVFCSKYLKCSFEKEVEKEFELSTSMKCDLVTGLTKCVRPVCDTLFLGGEVAVSNYEITQRVSSQTNDAKICEKFADFECLLDKNTYSDFKFIVEDRVFLVHKAVLGGRSSHFKNIFKEFLTLKCLSIEDLKPSVFEKFLVYLYSGKIGDDLETHLDLLLAWDKYNVSVLGAQLHLLLSHEITLENVCTVLLSLHNLKDVDCFDDVKNASISLVCCNFNDVEPSQSWENLVTQSNELAWEILLYMQDVYRLA